MDDFVTHALRFNRNYSGGQVSTVIWCTCGVKLAKRPGWIYADELVAHALLQRHMDDEAEAFALSGQG